MSDHREPVISVNVPSPSSANVPSLLSAQNNESFDKENVELSAKLVVQHAETTNSLPEDNQEASAIPASTFESNTITTKQPTSGICHNLTSVVPILSQCETPALAIPSTSTLAHSVVSLLPKVISPPSCPMPSTGHDNGGYSSNILKPNTAVNLQSLSRGTTSRPKVPVNETIPDVIPEFLPGKIDAKRFPARHFELSSLEIGSWKYESKSNGFFTPTTSRLKVIFSQRKFVYEFEMRSNSLSGILPLFQKEKIMASIEVPFSSVVGLNMSKESPCQVLIEVNSSPSMYIGKQLLCSPATGCAKPTKYDTSKNVDCTGGQLFTVPYHKLMLSSNQLKYRLQSFDPRFDALMRTPITVDVTKRLKREDTPVVKQRKSSNHTGEPAAKRPRKSSSSSISGETICTCSTGCNTQRCSCLKMNGICGSECKCVCCKNPLNILDNNGVDIAEAKEDACLMQNLMKMKDLDRFLKENIERTPCCESPLPMKDISVGEVECPNCGGEYRFSWCSLSLQDEECRPRNHCAVCKRCGDYRDAHCLKCNRCYFAGSGGLFKCDCSGRPSFMDSLGAFLSGLHDPESDSDNEYY